MDAALSTLIAVAGTLLGAVATHVFQRKADRRAQSFAAQQQLRAERMAVYSDFAGAVTEFRRGQQDRWHRRNEDPHGDAAFEARVEAHRLRGLALQALFRVQLISSSQRITDAAEHVYELTSDIHEAANRNELSAKGAEARQELANFVQLAARDVR
ncbi:hypothetical protein IHE55_20365 [Streptomyces pactum]|uniref:Protein kilB n=1 Tax=Streptomyces pactum TaxID=68249 RepID=A0ABS0NP63_9ACTN|nr:hypothetical protein [Streptomyces pactum]MBH5336989.1 hypothetical protein [Streptomyces pactum]